MNEIVSDCEHLLELLDKTYPGEKYRATTVHDMYYTVRDIIDDVSDDSMHDNYHLTSFIHPYIDNTRDYDADSEIVSLLEKIQNELSGRL
ncbi:hypothetical protein [Lacticaseibacillus pantheris]|nr:hypothetical protein [Lacticaseibacillus pantheris]